MNRKDLRKFIKSNKQIAAKCPKCGRLSVFATDKDLMVRCARCGEIVSETKMKQQCMLKFSKGRSDK